jgi:hypothetical protein
MAAGTRVGEGSFDLHASAALGAEVLIVAPNPRVLAVASSVLAFRERRRIHRRMKEQ